MNHDFLVYPDDEKDIQVYGFPNEFSQVVLNVLNNARDAFQEKGISNGRIEIHVGRDDGRAFLAVRDNAGGIAENDLPKIFDPYFTTKEKGTGIGLYMSKMILEHMDGTIEARNVQNGAEFRITLDLSASGEEEIRKPPQ
jgi:signal transduction histidine kinase